MSWSCADNAVWWAIEVSIGAWKWTVDSGEVMKTERATSRDEIKELASRVILDNSSWTMQWPAVGLTHVEAESSRSSRDSDVLNGTCGLPALPPSHYIDVPRHQSERQYVKKFFCWALSWVVVMTRRKNHAPATSGAARFVDVLNDLRPTATPFTRPSLFASVVVALHPGNPPLHSTPLRSLFYASRGYRKRTSFFLSLCMRPVRPGTDRRRATFELLARSSRLSVPGKPTSARTPPPRATQSITLLVHPPGRPARYAAAAESSFFFSASPLDDESVCPSDCGRRRALIQRLTDCDDQATARPGLGPATAWCGVVGITLRASDCLGRAGG